MNRTILILLAGTILAACGDSGHKGEHAEADEHGPAKVAHVATATVEAAGSARIRDLVQAYGAVALNAERTRHVSARFAGVVTAVAKAPGDRVAAGDTLASIESNESMQVYAVKAPIARRGDGTHGQRRRDGGAADPLHGFRSELISGPSSWCFPATWRVCVPGSP